MYQSKNIELPIHHESENYYLNNGTDLKSTPNNVFIYDTDFYHFLKIVLVFNYMITRNALNGTCDIL